MTWTYALASREFGVDVEQLKALLPVEPFSTEQVFAAVFGSLKAERLRLQTLLADREEIKNGIARGMRRWNAGSKRICVDEAGIGDSGPEGQT